MFKNIFNKTANNTQSAAKTAKFKNASHKKKNTYIIEFSPFCDPSLFDLCENTPLAVVTQNGANIQNTADFMTCTKFPNPGAAQMGSLYLHAPKWREIMGEKLSCTIIEYMDKHSGKPVLLLFPQNNLVSLVPGEDWATVANNRLNHASRKDLWHQIYNVRTPKIQAFKAQQNQR